MLKRDPLPLRYEVGEVGGCKVAADVLFVALSDDFSRSNVEERYFESVVVGAGL